MAVDGSPVDDFMDIQNRIITGKQQNAGAEGYNLYILKGRRKSLRSIPKFGARNPGYWNWSKGNIFHWWIITRYARTESWSSNGWSACFPKRSNHSFIFSARFYAGKSEKDSVSLTVRRGGEHGNERTFSLVPVEKEILVAGVQHAKMIGFRPKFKRCYNLSKSTYSNLQPGERHVSDLTGLVSLLRM